MIGATPGGPARGSRWRGADRFQHPARVIAVGFGVAVAVGTVLLYLPWATEEGSPATLTHALFTATSAVCLTGLVMVDTSGHWSPFGETVILALIQIGGLGIMTMATVLTLLLSRRLRLRARFLAQAETKSLNLQDLRGLIRRIVLFSLATETLVALVLALRLYLSHGQAPLEALYSGVFHAVSAFNNAGFALHADSLTRYSSDPVVCLSVAAAVIVGGLGFPVVFELAKNWRRPSRWSLMTRITVYLSAVLLALGTLVLTATEWTNRGTLGALAPGDRVLNGFFAATMARSSGFNSVDIGALRPESLLITDILMFIGGGSAGTAGGIKVTTFGVLAYMLWSEIRGEPHVNAGRRRIPATNQRQALAIALLSIGAVVGATFALMLMTAYTLDEVLFEVISAFATVGLSTGITADLPVQGHVLLVVLMFAGRIGPLTLASALALRERNRRYDLPEERTIVG
ncbi:potassium transporter Trk [Kineosporia sp. NBRC 101677]|uniref:TrkH family potassium uptake protein n=1 Tax=Kineosporia sp. NBRC 101677 TaxID=3032197 RepID=UPI0024A3D911|nr:potassium transporter TrkG [Kineosporia sp. NBRC 101677]GLY15358.1 potassium transporter Trk [Kineosporia sp. NBRC 101677]